MLLVMPDGTKACGTEVVLHACCAPCSAAIIESMLQNGMNPIVFFSNPNIYPLQEYEIRKEELKRFLRDLDIPFYEDDYDYDVWLEEMTGLESEPERGRRCSRCFLLRLNRTASFAESHHVRWFTTTLSSSRGKDYNQIVAAGNQAARNHEGLDFWPQNWRKGGLQQRRAELLRENNFYNQLYCGCEFSLRSREQK